MTDDPRKLHLIEQKWVDHYFLKSEALNITVIRRKQKEWYFTFEAKDWTSGELKLFATRRQRGGLRLWRDADLLIDSLNRLYGIERGSFLIKETETP